MTCYFLKNTRTTAAFLACNRESMTGRFKRIILRELPVHDVHANCGHFGRKRQSEETERLVANTLLLSRKPLFLPRRTLCTSQKSRFARRTSRQSDSCFDTDESSTSLLTDSYQTTCKPDIRCRASWWFDWCLHAANRAAWSTWELRHDHTKNSWLSCCSYPRNWVAYVSTTDLKSEGLVDDIFPSHSLFNRVTYVSITWPLVPLLFSLLIYPLNQSTSTVPISYTRL